LFGDAAAPESVQCRIVDWVEAGAFAEEPAALAEALTCACWLGRTGVAAFLLDRGVDPTAGMGTGMDALHWGANRGQLAVVNLLLVRGAPTGSRSTHGGTALGTAVWSAIHEPRADHLAIIEALLEAEARPAEVEYPTGHEGVDALLRRYTPPGTGSD
jgi:hypothetical protein